MNPSTNLPETNSRRPNRRRLKLKLAAGLAFVCLGTGLLLPVVKSRIESHHALPPGQFQADFRTMVAGVHYLLESESEPAMDKLPAVYSDRKLEVSGRWASPTVPPAVSSTNPPAPI